MRTLSRCSPCLGASSWPGDCVSLGKTGSAGGSLPPPTAPSPPSKRLSPVAQGVNPSALGGVQGLCAPITTPEQPQGALCRLSGSCKCSQHRVLPTSSEQPQPRAWRAGLCCVQRHGPPMAPDAAENQPGGQGIGARSQRGAGLPAIVAKCLSLSGTPPPTTRVAVGQVPGWHPVPWRPDLVLRPPCAEPSDFPPPGTGQATRLRGAAGRAAWRG